MTTLEWAGDGVAAPEPRSAEAALMPSLAYALAETDDDDYDDTTRHDTGKTARRGPTRLDSIVPCSDHQHSHSKSPFSPFSPFSPVLSKPGLPGHGRAARNAACFGLCTPMHAPPSASNAVHVDIIAPASLPASQAVQGPCLSWHVRRNSSRCRVKNTTPS